jgi:hypothetical protein
MGAVAAPFVQRMLLGFLDLATGYVLMEEVAAARRFNPWASPFKVA